MSKKSPVLYTLLRPVAEIGFRIYCIPKVVGRENIPKKGAVVIAGNHKRSIDCFMLFCGTYRCVHFLAKSEIFKGPLKYFFGGAGLIPVHRERKDHAALESAEEYLKMGAAVALFPEGGVNKTGNVIKPFKMGAIKMAHDTGSPIVPFTITGKYLPFHRPVIEFYEPFYVESDDLDAERAKFEALISEKLIAHRAAGK